MDLDDIFYIDKTDQENEDKIMQNERNNDLTKIKNMAYNEGYLDECTKEYPEIFEKGKEDGKKYSLEFGKLLGMIEAILFFISIDNNTHIQQTQIDTLTQLKEELENYQGKIDDDFVKSKREIIQGILSNIYG